MHDQRLVSEEQVLVERDQSAREGADTDGTRHARTRKVVVGLTGLLGAAWAVVLASRFSTFSF
ncbi:hypothetical protein [Methylobacterium sp. Leaf93]|uniref:hypothetical protein n=1 Tax=Methylobacterium sp. Leaf93 TaxID=1736249 RepID=UPI0006FC7563|nr:hypothetical protein [Methylobacterium sp. Leaf93]KQP04681.1 hypothetical protein ASF26_11200 [Methylobacterium sp. Leaf93]